MRILTILNTYPTLSETFIYNTLTNLQQQGYTVVIAARRKGQAPHKLDFKDIVYLPNENKRWYFSIVPVAFFFLKALVTSKKKVFKLVKGIFAQPRSWRSRLKLLRRLVPLVSIDADHTYFAHGGLGALYLEYIQLFPSHLSLRGSDINIEPLLSEEYASRLQQALLHSKGIHCVCEDILVKAKKLSNHPLSHAQVIYTALNPIFLRHSTPNKESSQIQIISVGRLNWRKGLEHGMMAIKALSKQHSNIQWLIIGDGDYHVALQWAIRDLELEQHVKLLGSHDQNSILTYLQCADIYFHPTVHEGISNAVLEAMALGLPVVCSDVGGMREAIDSDQNGILVTPRDWKGMANALEALISNPSLRHTLGARARDDVEARFSLERQQQAFVEFFTQPIVE